MSNMSYCRFHNTLLDFRDCSSALQAMVEPDDDGPLSKDETYAAKMLIAEMVELITFLADYAGKDVADIFNGYQHPAQILEESIDGLNQEQKEYAEQSNDNDDE